MSQEPNLTECLAVAETSLGQVLTAIHRILPRLDDASRLADVQAAFRKAAAGIEAARTAHERGFSTRRASTASDITAVIAAAVAVVLDRPHRVVSVEPVPVPSVPHFNVWAFEGRTQIFQSHKVR
jgi:hypothetical protein